MNGMLLFISEERDFDRDRMIEILLSIDGIYFDNLESAKRDSSIDVIRGWYDYRGYSNDFTFRSHSSSFGFGVQGRLLSISPFASNRDTPNLYAS